jgi:hypothetical protein
MFVEIFTNSSMLLAKIKLLPLPLVSDLALLTLVAVLNNSATATSLIYCESSFGGSL